MSGNLQLQIYTSVDGASVRPDLYPDLTPQQLIKLPVRCVLGTEITARFETLHPGLVNVAVKAMMDGHVISLRGRIAAPVDDIYRGLLQAFRNAVASKAGWA